MVTMSAAAGCPALATAAGRGVTQRRDLLHSLLHADAIDVPAYVPAAGVQGVPS